MEKEKDESLGGYGGYGFSVFNTERERREDGLGRGNRVRKWVSGGELILETK